MSRFMLFFWMFFLSLSSISSNLLGQEKISTGSLPFSLTLSGHLDVEAMDKATSTFESLKKTSKTLLIQVNSSSGEFRPVMDFAKRIYEWRRLQGGSITVFMDEAVLGPAAILPFLADSLEASFLVSWGAIADRTSPSKNILRSAVKSLISSTQEKRALYLLLAEGMLDPDWVVMRSQEGDLLMDKKVSKDAELLSPLGETLVINQRQIVDLGLSFALKAKNKKDTNADLSAQNAKNEKGVEKTIRAASSTLQERLETHIPFKKTEKNLIGHLLINDWKSGINEATWIYVKSALDYYKKIRPSCIILELDTPGGELYATQRIADALQKIDSQHHIPVIALINNHAYSAGAMLAYSCRFIFHTSDASMGAAEVVFQTQEGMETAPEKVNSAFRTDFANCAQYYDRNPILAEAMVDKHSIVVLRHGKVIKLDEPQQIRYEGMDPDIVISARNKLLTLSAKQLVDLKVGDYQVSFEGVSLKTEKALQRGKWPLKQSLLHSHPYFAAVPQAEVLAYRMDWKLHFIAFLATPWVSSLLFLGLMLGIYMEFNTPGLGLPGLVASICLFLMVLASFSIQAAHVLDLVMVFLGLFLLALEVFVIPGFGLVGFFGLVFVLSGVLSMMLPAIDTVSYDMGSRSFNVAGEVFAQRLAWLCGSILVFVFLMFLFARYGLHRLGMLRQFVSQGEQNVSEGYVSGLDPQTLPEEGSLGQSYSPLRPSGKVLIDGEVFDAQSLGVFIEKDRSIVVTQVRGSLLIVKEKI